MDHRWSSVRGAPGGGRARFMLFVCLLCCLCFRSAVGQATVVVVQSGGSSHRPPPPVCASSPTQGVIDPTLYHPHDAACLMKSIKKYSYQEFLKDRPMAASLLRLSFHDCLTKGGGCDASILKPGEITDPNNINEGLRITVPVITRIRQRAAEECGVYPTMADAIARAGAAAIAFSGLADPTTAGFLLGRRDIADNQPGDDARTLPDALEPLDNILTKLTGFGLSLREVTVFSLGGHSVGKSACSHFNFRLNNGSTPGGCQKPVDPTLDPALACKLAKVCGDPNADVKFDFGTPFSLDNNYFKLLLKHQALLRTDQAFATHSGTASFVREYANGPKRFAKDFLKAFVKVELVSINGPTTAPPKKYYY
ncbi:Class III Peroxidase [Chara braunii]|uniref:Peroxidase n=1 Tax=Chara braunii TaxID=69332 RepID=A0A388M088_CHABU|nr:Class III Peroxidase [Chara braunii]|eukprot:GBG87978.1 Class III Peroxidase [Chara braunii]